MNRIYHTWDKWECYPAGFYDDNPPNGMSKSDAVDSYRDFLSDLDRFRSGLEIVISTWKNSCEHYLSNEKMNRIAWLGQAAMCASTGVPSAFRSGYNLLSEIEKTQADLLALEYLNRWLKSVGEDQLTIDGAKSKTEANLY